MPISYDSQRLRNQRAMDKRLTADHVQLARAIANLVLRAAQPDGLIANTRAVREALRTAIWEQVLKPFYVGSSTDALKGASPQSPYARLLVDGIEQATRIQAERQAAIVRRVVKDADVVAWLTGPRSLADLLSLPVSQMPSFPVAGIAFNPNTATIGGLRGADGRIDVTRAREALVKPRGMYEPFHAWVDPNGYRLSDRIWRTSVEVRSRVDLLMEYHIQRGTSAVEIADLVEPFLTPGGLTPRTRTPYGTEGSYAARRLARTEITAAAGRATVNASIANPFVAGVQWRLSGSHPKIDICDDYARGGPNGDGIYTPETAPRYPAHPFCLCALLPVPAGNTADLVESLRDDIRAAREGLINSVGGRSANALRGLLNPEYLTRALMNGNLDEAVAMAVQRARSAPIARLPRKVASTVQNAPTWKPSMGRDEADQWAANSAYKEPLYHGTANTQSATSIQDNGFSLAKIRGGRVYGDGVYLSPAREQAEFWAKNGQRQEGMALPIKINVKNPWIVDRARFVAEIDDFIEKEFPSSKPRGTYEEFMAAVAKAKTNYIQSKGYDAVIIMAPRDSLYKRNFTEWIQRYGGDQAIIFDPKNVTVIND